MKNINIIGDIKVTVSDYLFNSENVKRITLYHVTDGVFTHKPETRGEIIFISDDVEGTKKFKGSNIMEVIAQMTKFLETIR